MAIYAPGRRINPTIQRKTGGFRKNVFAGLSLTSMVDMFAIMVVFLLQMFSSDAELFVPKDFELPEVENTGHMTPAPVLMVARDKIEFEGKFIANTNDLAAQEGWVLPLLQDELKAHKEKALKEFEEKKANGKLPADATQEKAVNILADRRLQFQVIKKIIYNASFAGYPDFRFAVFGKSALEKSEE